MLQQQRRLTGSHVTSNGCLLVGFVSAGRGRQQYSSGASTWPYVPAHSAAAAAGSLTQQGYHGLSTGANGPTWQRQQVPGRHVP